MNSEYFWMYMAVWFIFSLLLLVLWAHIIDKVKTDSWWGITISISFALLAMPITAGVIAILLVRVLVRAVCKLDSIITKIDRRR